MSTTINDTPSHRPQRRRAPKSGRAIERRTSVHHGVRPHHVTQRAQIAPITSSEAAPLLLLGSHLSSQLFIREWRWA